jgi:hypothetical protein
MLKIKLCKTNLKHFKAAPVPILSLSPCPKAATVLNLYTCTLNIQSFNSCLQVKIDYGDKNSKSNLIQDVCLTSKL